MACRPLCNQESAIKSIDGPSQFILSCLVIKLVGYAGHNAQVSARQSETDRLKDN